MRTPTNNLRWEIQMEMDRQFLKFMKISNNPFNGIIALIILITTGMVGYHIHGSIGWSIVDVLLWPFAWIKWICCHNVSLSVLRDTFSFLWN